MVEKSRRIQDIIDNAFSMANKTASALPQRKKYLAAFIRIRTAANTIAKQLERSMEIPTFSAFEKALLSTSVDLDKLWLERKSLQQSVKIIRKLQQKYEARANEARDPVEIASIRKAFYGRISDVLKKTNAEEIQKLNQALPKLPKLRNEPTIIVCGAPNVGKSMIVSKLTGHKLKVAPYPFTTTRILIGFMPHKREEIQLIDTPGLLDRPLESHNDVERRAIIALRFLSKDIIFVLDPSETCGYSLESQLHLMESIKKEFKPRALVVATKKDLPCKEFNADISINCNLDEDIEALRAKLLEFFFKDG